MAIQNPIESLVASLFDIRAIEGAGATLSADLHTHYDPHKRGELTRDHLCAVAEVMALCAYTGEERLKFDAIAGLPGASAHIAYAFVHFAPRRPLPLISLKMVGMEDTWNIRADTVPVLPPQSRVLLVGDYARSGSTLCEGARALGVLEFEVTDALVFLDFEQEAQESLFTQGVRLHSVIKKTDIPALRLAIEERREKEKQERLERKPAA